MNILTYHKVVDKQNFGRQLSFLKRKRYNVLSLDEFKTKYFSGSLKARDVLITFDDGEYSVYENAMPLLKEFGFPSVLFIITGIIGTDQPFWWDEIMHYSGSMDEVRRAKKVSNAERLQLLDQMRLHKNGPSFRQRQLNIGELRELEQNGMSIANHTNTHPMLDKVTKEELMSELNESVKFLRDNGFKHFDALAYPNGNISEEAIQHLQTSGIRLGFMFDHLPCKKPGLPYRISRLSVNDHTPMWKFRLITSGIHSRYLAIRKRLKRNS